MVKKDKVRFGVVVLMFLFIGLLVFGMFYLSYGIEQNFTGKIKQDSSTITRDDLTFVEVFFELYSFPGCKEVNRDYEGDVVEDKTTVVGYASMLF